MLLKESSELFKGIFWIVDPENMNENKKYCFMIPTDSEGNNISGMELNSKNELTLNHERVWKELPKKLTHNLSFNYYPRGRVEISHEKAIIYVNPNICTEEIKQFIIEEFNLYSLNDIKSVRIVADGSFHYKCHLDN